MAVEGAAEDHAVEHELDALVPLRHTELAQQHHVARGVGPRAVEAGRLVADVQQGDHPEVCRGGPDRVELRVHHGNARDGDRADQEGAAAAPAHAGELTDGGVDVVEVETGDGEQPVGVTLDRVGEPGVAGGDHLGRERPGRRGTGR